MKDTIDMTPSWEGTVPIIQHLLLSGGFEAQKSAMESIVKMAKLADAYVAHLKAVDAQIDELAKAEASND